MPGLIARPNHACHAALNCCSGQPGSQQTLLEAVYQANPKTVLVLINGGALGVDWAKDHIPAIVEAF